MSANKPQESRIKLMQNYIYTIKKGHKYPLEKMQGGFRFKFSSGIFSVKEFCSETIFPH
jgi:hypothetical protein